MFNKIIMLGNLTRQPELKHLPSGSAICNTAIATNRKFKNQAGEQKEEVCFIDITLFGRTAEIANQYLNKGSKVLIEGRLKLDQWTDQNGNKRSKHGIVVENLQMLDTKGQNSGDNNDYGSQNQDFSQQEQTNSAPKDKENISDIDIGDDEIPF